jgi:DNA-binding NtrC family response regulator
MSDRKSILIVEDLENWREVFSGILKDEYHIEVAQDYQRAMQALLDNHPPFDLMIVDLRLMDENEKDESGLLLLDQIRRCEEYTSTIVVTGYPTFETHKKALHDFNAFDYIEKYPADEDFNIAFFKSIVRQAIENTEKQRTINRILESANEKRTAQDE